MQTASRNRWLAALLWLASAVAAHPQETPHFRAQHVVLVVWDGMRPDLLTPESAPNATRLATEGAFFEKNHAVYVTSTEVNCAALSTGCYPNHNGILANREYRPDLNLVRPIGTEMLPYIRISDALTDRNYLLAPTLPEILQAAGNPTAIAGAKPVVTLMDRSLDRKSESARKSVVLYSGATLPREGAAEIEAAIGPFPTPPDDPFGTFTFREINDWTARALTEVLWKDGVPKYSVLWLGDPDLTQHQFGPGSEPGMQSIRECDAELGRVLAALRAKGELDSTDIFVVSDHGFSTVNRTVETMSILTKAGIRAAREFQQTPRPGEALAVNLGGSMMLYAPDHDKQLIKKMVELLQASDFAGPIFTKSELPGVFPFSAARIDTPNAPDVMFSYRWSDEKNRFDLPGSLTSEPVARKRAGFGSHASLSPFDVHNTLLAFGPDIKRGFRDKLPSGNVDVAPTILHLLGVTPPQPMDGRILSEALVGESFDEEPIEETVEAAAPMENSVRRQSLKFTKIGRYRYLDEGNVESTPGITK